MKKTLIKFNKFKKALNALDAIHNKPTLDDRSNIDATIQRFEFTFELFWKFLKDFFYEKGIELFYPKDILKYAYADKIINDEDLWLRMLKDRNLTSHTYNEALADEIFLRIHSYVPLFIKVLLKMEEILHNDNT